MIRRPPRSTLSSSSAASDVYKRQVFITSIGTKIVFTISSASSKGFDKSNTSIIFNETILIPATMPYFHLSLNSVFVYKYPEKTPPKTVVIAQGSDVTPDGSYKYL